MPEKYERSFVVAVPVTAAWAAFTEPKGREAWMVPAGRDPLTHAGTPPTEGFERGQLRLGLAELQRGLSWSQSPAGLDGWYQTVVRFEEVLPGTRITIVRSGFGNSEAWRHYASNTARGWDEQIADLILYLETGVRGSRHWAFRSSLGATMLEASSGVRITHVVPGGFAAAAGMQAGDLLLRLNGASVVHLTDVAFAGREHAAGVEIEAEYVRGSDVLRGRAPLSEWHYGGGRFVGHPGAYPRPSLAGR